MSPAAEGENLADKYMGSRKGETAQTPIFLI